MVRTIITYPTPPSVQYGTDVRFFDSSLFELLQDLKDTIEANHLQALAAFQIGSYYNVVTVKKEDGEFLELINPRLLSSSGSITSQESTAYFPGLTAEVTRFETISVIYQDREGKDQSLKANGAFAVLLQRKLDYTFGSSFINKLSKEEKKRFEKKLEFGSDVAISESCPTTFKRDYLQKASKAAFVIMFAMIVIALLFSNDDTKQNLWEYQLYGSYFVVLMQIVYIFYGQYEGKRYSSCTSCQIGNIIGTAAIALFKLTLIMVISYFLIKP
ncbi:MAG: peptide deformylase [Epsilonproteobacteria bacterium]|nr:peptide deformylase [Campylobacterota bacterium]